MARRRATKKKDTPYRQGKSWRRDSPWSPLMRLLYGERPLPPVYDADPRSSRWGNDPIPLPPWRGRELVVPPGEMPVYDDDPRMGQTRPGGEEYPPMGRYWLPPVRRNANRRGRA